MLLFQDVQGLNSPKPDIVCLHSLKNEQAAKASIKVMKDIQWTSFENAKRLVQIGAAQPTDFWVFMGYAGKLDNSLCPCRPILVLVDLRTHQIFSC